MLSSDGSVDDARAAIVGRLRALRDVQRTQASALDRLLQAITASYRDELAHAGRSPEQRRCERVRALLEDGPLAGAELDSELEYDLDGWHLGMIATGSRAERTVQELAAGIYRGVLSVTAGRESVWAWLGGSERPTHVDIEQILANAVPPAGVVVALGEPAQGLEGWRLTHRQAQAALVVALRQNGIPPARERVGLTRYADVALLAAALKDDALAEALIDAYVAPLEDSRGAGAVLGETLRAYLAAERSVSSTAAALGVVRKTVTSRLRTIEERLGRSLHPCPAELEIALLLDELTPKDRLG